MNNLPRLASNRNPPDLCVLVARITGVSHWHLASNKFLLSIYYILGLSRDDIVKEGHTLCPHGTWSPEKETNKEGNLF
jgi:argonaute-like protein implicated in RNA metabolism and viral defense